MTRAEAFDLMLVHARQLGGDAVIGVRYDACEDPDRIARVDGALPRGR